MTNKDIEVDVEVHQMPALYMLETQMPEKMVKDLNTYLDDLLKQDDRQSLQVHW